MLKQRSQGQTSTPLAALVALLEHPEFQQGLETAYQSFLDEYEPGPLSEEEMMAEVEANLSPHVYERDRASCQALGWKPSSYLCHLGYVVGTIVQGLNYGEGQPC